LIFLIFITINILEEMTSTDNFMDKWIDNRPFEVIVAATEALPAHENIVAEILRDKKSGWRYNYFKPDGHSTHDAQLNRMNTEKAACEANIKTNKGLIETLDKNIRCARLPPNDKDYKKAKPDMIANWDKQYVQAEEDIMVDTKRSIELEGLIHQWSWNRYLELGRERTLYRLRNKFMIDNDIEFLRKGVTWASEYELKRRYKLDLGEELNAKAAAHEDWIANRVDNSAW
jgi:hypothetical protein